MTPTHRPAELVQSEGEVSGPALGNNANRAIHCSLEFNACKTITCVWLAGSRAHHKPPAAAQQRVSKQVGTVEHHRTWRPAETPVARLQEVDDPGFWDSEGIAHKEAVKRRQELKEEDISDSQRQPKAGPANNDFDDCPRGLFAVGDGCVACEDYKTPEGCKDCKLPRQCREYWMEQALMCSQLNGPWRIAVGRRAHSFVHA